MGMLHRLPWDDGGSLFALVGTALGRHCRTLALMSVLMSLAGAAAGEAAAASLDVKSLSRHQIDDVVDYISRERGGCVTVALDDGYETRYGAQDLKYINANTINIDLQILGVKPRELERALTRQARQLPADEFAGAAAASLVEIKGTRVVKAEGLFAPAAARRLSAESGGGTARPAPEPAPATPADKRLLEAHAQPSGENHPQGRGPAVAAWFAGLLTTLTLAGAWSVARRRRARHAARPAPGGRLRSGSFARPGVPAARLPESGGLDPGRAAAAVDTTAAAAGGSSRKYDHDWLKRYGFDPAGDAREGLGTEAASQPGDDRPVFDEYGYDREGYDREGRDGWGYDRAGYDKSGYDRKGYDREGFNCQGYDREGYDREGYDAFGYNRSGHDPRGARRPALPRAPLAGSVPAPGPHFNGTGF